VLASVLAAVAAPELLPGAARKRGGARPSAAPAAGGSIRLQTPAEAPQALMRVSVLRSGEYARGTGGGVLSQVPPERLAETELAPGWYVVILRYRGTPVSGIVAQVGPGRQAPVTVPREELAAIEYQAGLRASGEGGAADVPYFRRTLAMDPDHLNAHLQLAAYALLRGAPREVRTHLAAVRRVSPGNPHAARVERLLNEKEGRR
jgi:hypothetical protein